MKKLKKAKNSKRNVTNLDTKLKELQNRCFIFANGYIKDSYSK